MSDMNRREFFTNTAQSVGGMLVCCLFGENLLAEEVPVKGIEATDPVDENFWIGGY